MSEAENSTLKNVLGADKSDFASTELFWTAISSSLIASSNIFQRHLKGHSGFSTPPHALVEEARGLATLGEALAILAREEPRRDFLVAQATNSSEGVLKERLLVYEKLVGLASYFQDKPTLQEGLFIPWLAAKGAQVEVFWQNHIQSYRSAQASFEQKLT